VAFIITFCFVMPQKFLVPSATPLIKGIHKRAFGWNEIHHIRLFWFVGET